MTENIKKIIILGNREEKSEILKICSEWELFFKRKMGNRSFFYRSGCGTDAYEDSGR